MTPRTRIASLLAALLAAAVGHTMYRHSLSLDARYPPLDPSTGARSLYYFGDLNPFMYTLLNVVAAPFLPRRIDSSKGVRIMNESIARFPKAARALGFLGGECEDFWRRNVREWEEDGNEIGWISPLGLMIGMGMFEADAASNAALMEFLEPRMQGDSLPELDPSLQLLFIAGNYRTGTSVLQRTIASDARVIAIPQWALLTNINVSSSLEAKSNPSLVDSNDPNNGLRQLSKEVTDNFEELHSMDADAAEEDGLNWSRKTFGFGLGMQGFQLFFQPRSGKCCKNKRTPKRVSEDMVARRCFFSKALPGLVKAWLHPDSALMRLSNRTSPAQVVVLKAPVYALGIREIKEAFPRAKVVATHRTPYTQAQATAFMWLTWSAMFASPEAATHPRDAGLNILDHTEVLANELAKNKAFLDMNLYHDDIKKDPASAAEHVLEKLFGLHRTPGTRLAMTTYLKTNGAYKGWHSKPKDPRCLAMDWEQEVQARAGFKRYQEAFFT